MRQLKLHRVELGNTVLIDINGKENIFNCAGCWNYMDCSDRHNPDLAWCYRKGYTCRYCSRTECEKYNMNIRCFCSEFVKKGENNEIN